jgi:hypothetical protein
MPQPYSRRSPAPVRRRAAVATPPARLSAGLVAVALFLLALVLTLLLPGAAGAQITTGLTPPESRAARDSVVAAEGTIAAARDSVAREERLDLRAWVDSAAGSLNAGADPISPIPGAPADSVVANADVGTPAGVVSPAGPTRRPTTTFREGAPAPNTATPLPLLAAAGGVLTAAGAWLRRRR